MNLSNVAILHLVVTMAACFTTVAGLQCISCAYLTFDTGIDVINDVIDKELNFSDTECTDNSQSQGVIVCEEGEVCMAIKTALTVTVEALGAEIKADASGIYRNCTSSPPGDVYSDGTVCTDSVDQVIQEVKAAANRRIDFDGLTLIIEEQDVTSGVTCYCDTARCNTWAKEQIKMAPGTTTPTGKVNFGGRVEPIYTIIIIMITIVFM